MAGGTGSGDPTESVRNPDGAPFLGALASRRHPQDIGPKARPFSVELRLPAFRRFIRTSRQDAGAPREKRTGENAPHPVKGSPGRKQGLYVAQNLFGRRRKVLGDTESFWATQSSLKRLGNSYGRHRNFLRRPSRFWATQNFFVSLIEFLGDIETFCVAQKLSVSPKMFLRRP